MNIINIKNDNFPYFLAFQWFRILLETVSTTTIQMH